MFQYERLSEELKNDFDIYISVKSKKHFKGKIDSKNKNIKFIFENEILNNFDFYHFNDDYDKKNFTPLFGILSSLIYLNEKCIFLPVDMPYVKIETLLKIDLHEEVYVKDSKREHFLLSKWSVKNIYKLIDYLKNDILKVGTIVKELNFEILNFADESQFLNINKPQDYKNKE